MVTNNYGEDFRHNDRYKKCKVKQIKSNKQGGSSMGLALKQMLKIAPIIKPQKEPVRDMFVRTKMMLGNSDNIDWFNTEVPYIGKINDYISKNGKLSKICFLVTEQDSIARSAATYISANERHIYEESKNKK